MDRPSHDRKRTKPSPSGPPSEQEIVDQLAGLNQQSRYSWSPNVESARAWQRGMRNYLKWFIDHNIDVYQDTQDGIWKIGTAPILTPKQKKVKKFGG